MEKQIVPSIGSIRVMETEDNQKWLSADDLIVSLHYDLDLFNSGMDNAIEKENEKQKNITFFSKCIINQYMENIILNLEEICENFNKC